MSVDASDTSNFGVNSQGIARGVNNPIIKNIAFKFDMVNPNVARLTMTDAEKTRFSPPENVVPKPKEDINQ
jgi:hypothetical protein